MRFAPRLDTPRLTLRPMAPRDLLFYWQLVGHPQVRKYLGGPVPRRARLSRFFGLLSVGAGVGTWVVCTKAGGKAIGLVELGLHKDGQDIELSYQFHPSRWGSGFAREAAARVVAHGLTDMQLPRIIAETQAANGPSRHMLKCLGFVEHSRLIRFGDEQVILATTTFPVGAAT